MNFRSLLFPGLPGFFGRSKGGNAVDGVCEQRLQHPEVRRAFRALKGWSLAYLVASALELIASFLAPYHGAGSSVGSWIRCAVVTAIAALIYALVLRSAHGHGRSYRTLQVVAYLESIGFILVAVIVPGYPTWLRIVSLAIGLIAIGTALATSNRHLRRAFTAGPADRPAHLAR